MPNGEFNQLMNSSVGQLDESTSGAWLLNDLAAEYSLIRPFLTTSDLFCVRRTCKAAWSRVKHRTLHKQNILWKACGDQHTALVGWALDAGAPVRTGTAWMIGEFGDPQLLLRLRESYPAYVQYALYGCADGASEEVLRLIVHHPAYRMLVTVAVRSMIARRGLMDLAQELEPRASMWRDECPDDVCASGNVEFVQWALAGLQPHDVPEISCDAASSGSIPVLEWLVDRGVPLVPRTMVKAACEGHTETLRWLASRGVAAGTDALEGAASGGHLSALQWLVDHNCTVTASAVYEAARHGRLAVVQWLLDNAPTVEEHLVAVAAAEDESCSVLRWWVSQGFKWEPRVVAQAALSVRINFAVARFVCEVSGALSPNFTDIAARFGDIEELRYGIEHGVPLSEGGVDGAMSSGQTATLQYVLDHGLLGDGGERVRAYLLENEG
jgi:hypothetical protein